MCFAVLCHACCSMEPIDRIHCIQKERWELLCIICRQRMGAKIQCHDCYQVCGVQLYVHGICSRPQEAAL